MNKTNKEKRTIEVSEATAKFMDALQALNTAANAVYDALDFWLPDEKSDQRKCYEEKITDSCLAFENAVWETMCECMKENGLNTCINNKILLSI